MELCSGYGVPPRHFALPICEHSSAPRSDRNSLRNLLRVHVEFGLCSGMSAVGLAIMPETNVAQLGNEFSSTIKAQFLETKASYDVSDVGFSSILGMLRSRPPMEDPVSSRMSDLSRLRPGFVLFSKRTFRCCVGYSA